MERWKPVVGYEEQYEVSDHGNLRSVIAGRSQVKKPSLSRGYLRAVLYRNGKSKCAQVHRLVLEAFVGPAPVNHDGGHLDNNRSNNRLENLAWVSRADNQLHRLAHGTSLWGPANPNTKLTPRQVAEIRALAGVVPSSELAKRYGVERTTVQKIISGASWRDDFAERLAASEAALQRAIRK